MAVDGCVSLVVVCLIGRTQSPHNFLKCSPSKKWLSTKKIREAQELAEQEKAEAAETGEKTLEMQETTPIEEKDSGTDEDNQSGGDENV